ncbi:MAG TPA: lytic transglycosylase domain-containing protein [Thiobacillaceae bacterium]|nr:lytic transglycosylase domain-containing protein [Thiobacillaceae bacterium]
MWHARLTPWMGCRKLGLPSRALLTGALCCVLAGAAHAGAQKEENLSQSVRFALQKAVADVAVSRTAFSNRADEAAWLQDMSRRLARFVPDEQERVELLTTIHWEASRAGLDPQLVLGLIQVESGFHKYATSIVGARGYMQVMPFWTRQIGSREHNLFQLRTNLRYGCVILRHYIDMEQGDLFRALGRYNGSLGQPEYPNMVVGAWKRNWDYLPRTKTAMASLARQNN